MNVEVGGFFGLIWLVLAVWAIVSVVQSRASTGGKVFWIVFVILFPIFGFLCWLLFGPKKARLA
jgi:hypothetical protein